jgi:hypothetical protein
VGEGVTVFEEGVEEGTANLEISTFLSSLKIMVVPGGQAASPWFR